MINKERDLLFAVLEADKKVKEIETQIKAFDNPLKSAYELKEKAEQELMEFMDDTGKERFRSADFNVDVIKKETLRVSFRAEKKEEGIEFIEEECGRADAIRRDPNIHHKTLTSIIQDRLKNAEPVPDGLFNLYFQKTLDIKELKK